MSESNDLLMDDPAPARPAPIKPAYRVSEATRERISEIIDGGCFAEWYGGPVAREFEDEFAAAIGAGFAIAVNSGTSALHVAVAAAGIGPGDEVIVPAAAYISAASVVVQQGAVPVVCDIEESSCTIDSERLEAHITPRTRAIIPVHFWGCPSDMDALAEVAARRDLIVIEDCGQSHGSTVGERTTGSIGRFGCFSFAPRKHITTGQGGMVTCRTEEDAERMRALVNKGKGLGWLDYEELGFSYAMPEIEAAIGLDGLGSLGDEIERRRGAAEVFREELADTPLTIPEEPSWGRHVYFKVPVLLPPEAAPDRVRLAEAISKQNVSCRLTHPPVYSIPWLADYAARHGSPYSLDSFPVAERVLGRAIEVESGPNLTPEDVRVSARAVKRVWQSYR